MLPIYLPYFCVVLIDGPLEAVARDIVDRSPKCRAVPSSLEKFDFSYHAEPVLWEPASAQGKTAVSRSAYEYFLSARFKYRCISVRSSSLEEEWPINELELYEDGERRRFLRAFRDDAKWDFHEMGERLWFEEEDRYRRRRIRDRVDREMLLRYLLQLGWDVTAPEFWSSIREPLRVEVIPEPSKPCPFCGEMLKSPRAEQCLHCKADWHNVSAQP